MIEFESQAARITRICGVEHLAKWAGVSETSVYRWDHPKEKGGSGGVIPSTHHQAILDGARAAEIALSPSDFFETANDQTPAPVVVHTPAPKAAHR